MYKREDINIIVNKLVSLIKDEFPVREVYLFGSYANGNPNEYSDIDLAIVSDGFKGVRFWDREKLGIYTAKVSFDLEVHPYKTEYFTDDDPFVKEIIKSGLKIV